MSNTFVSTGGPAEQGYQKRADPGDADVPGQFRHVPDTGFVPGSVPAASPETRFAILRMGLVRLRSLKKKAFERYFPNIPKIFTQKNIFIILRNNCKSLRTKSKSSWRRPGQDPGARWPMHDNHQVSPTNITVVWSSIHFYVLDTFRIVLLMKMFLCDPAVPCCDLSSDSAAYIPLETPREINLK